MNVAKHFDPFLPPETNFVDRLRYWTLAQPDEVAYRFLEDGEDQVVCWTYSELDSRVRAIAAHLNSLGLRGQRALLMYPPGLDFVAAFFACHYAAMIPVPAYPPRRNRNMGRVNAISEDAGTAVALTVHDVVRRVEDLLDDAPSLKQIPWVATDHVPLELASDWVEPRIEPGDVGLLQYTSGSTGSPKGVVLTHGNLMMNCNYIVRGFQPTRDGEGMTWLPAYHDMGLVGGVLFPLYYGRPNTLMSPLHFLTKPVRWLRALSRYGTIISGGPNFAYALCCEKISDSECEGLDLSRWQVAFNGAEPLRADVLAEFTRRFSRYGFAHRMHYPCYGMAETTLIVTGGTKFEDPVVKTFDRQELVEHRVVAVDADSENARPLVGCGRPFEGEKVIIVHPETHKQLADDQIGEIWVKGPCVGKGYWNKPEETLSTFHASLAGGGKGYFLRTGDLGFIDEGQLYVTGRLKDMIIVRGVNRYPQDIEATVEQSSTRLRAASAVAFSVEHWDRERLIVVCEVERGTNKQWGDVLQAVRASVTGEHDLPPDAIILVRAGSVPKTSSGKVQRHACRQAYLDSKLLIVAQWRGWAEDGMDAETVSAAEINGKPEVDVDGNIVAVVMEHVKRIAKERSKNLNIDTNIVVDLGLDSLERLQIANSLEETFGGRFPDDVLQEIETVREVAHAIQMHIGTEPVRVGDGLRFETVPTIKKVEGPIPESYYQFDKMPEYIRLQRMNSIMQATGVRNPYFTVHEGVICDQTTIAGQRLISFSSYNYLGLSGDARVGQAAKDAIDQFGTSASASRLVSGEKTIHHQFEKELADFLSVDDALAFAGGHATNESVIGHLVGPGDLIIHDSLAHNSIIQGAELSGARRRPFEHNNWELLDSVLQEIRHDYRRVLIAIEGLYSMDGDCPDLTEFVRIKQKHKVWLFVDEAHSIGTLGPTGRGLGEVFGVPRPNVDIWMGTLSKSFGSCGGFIAGNKQLVEYLRYTTPGFIFAAAMPPSNVGAALAALRILRQEPQRVRRLQDNSALFLSLAKAAGLNTGMSNNSPIIPVITGNSLVALKLSQALFNRQINVQPIFHPAVEEDKARLRFFITSEHTEKQIRQAVSATAEEWSKLVSDAPPARLYPVPH